MNFLESLVDAIMKVLNGIFKPKKEEEKGFITISHIPFIGERSETVKVLQKALNKEMLKHEMSRQVFGNTELLEVDGIFGEKTEEAVSKFQKSIGLQGSGIIGPKTLKGLGLAVKANPEYKEPTSNKIPWFWALKKHEGKHETNSTFNSYLSSYWSRVGLPSFKSIVGSPRAWCGLFGAVGLIYAGYKIPVKSFRAMEWDNYCQAIDWKKNGFPQGAFVRINNKSNCTSWKGNHITLANGSCSAKDLLKPNATFSGFGGNQGNKAKVSTYSVSRICSVRWPCEQPLPKKVIQSKNCSNGITEKNESTR